MCDQGSSPHFLIVVGGSAGAIWPLIQLLQHLPAQLSAAIFVVMHIQARQSLSLPQTLQPWGNIPILDAIDQLCITPGFLYTSPSDRHLLVTSGRMRVVRGPKEHGFRPAIDPLFRTAAKHYKNQVIGVVLSGGLWDGTAGLAAIKAHGGITIVQDPEEALVPSMPQSAIYHGVADHVLSIAQIADLLVTLTQQSGGASLETIV